MTMTFRSTVRAAAVALPAVLLLSACGPADAEVRPTPGGADSASAQASGDTTPATPAAPSLDSLRAAFATLMAADTAGAGAAAADTGANRRRWLAGTNPAYAVQRGWPVEQPPVLPGSILPFRRIVAYYGNPLSTRMGILGELPKDQMLARLDAEVAKWNAADPTTPVIPALHMVAVVAQGEPGPSGDYRTIMRDSLVEMVYGWAQERDAIFFVDIQTGLSSIQSLAPRFEKFLLRPDVHLAVDPEFMMGANGARPGTRIGSMSAADINWTIRWLSDLVQKNNLPPKVLVLHRFTRNMITNYRDIRLDPHVQVVIDMDGWGAPWLKRDSYRDYVVQEPIQFTGFKLFYGNDTKRGDPLMQPADLLQLRPVPRYIQYQ